ncbi:IS5 family transposase [Microtetraspora sp. NBRC 13810]|uniref:transposase family protein n=1 Tax=Microtetraspora sp. NBRC 13810 TaxID=3030990 RepID=UPI0024A56A2D|nr:transposase family protein [Microtetraspora sp. NBRC 13810]GLW12275.1 IS5 family transposase [Microtetraspora sp. NBRC 13810]
MLFYRAVLPLSRRTLTYLAGVIRRHRALIGSPWRRLNPAQQAMLVLVHLRKGETFAEVAAGFGVGAATAWRYVHEAVALLAQRSPTLDQALRTAKRAGYAFVVLDGTLIPIDRVAADRPYYSGKHRHHGMNVQVLAAPDGTPLWTSGSLPGSVHDLTAARIWGIIRRLEAAGLITLADKAYVGAGRRVLVPYKGRNKPASQKVANSAHAKLRGPGERANAVLKTWRILRKLRCCPLRAGQLVKAIFVLQARETG